MALRSSNLNWLKNKWDSQLDYLLFHVCHLIFFLGVPILMIILFTSWLLIWSHLNFINIFRSFWVIAKKTYLSNEAIVVGYNIFVKK